MYLPGEGAVLSRTQIRMCRRLPWYTLSIMMRENFNVAELPISAPLTVRWLGRQEYRAAWELQQRLAEQRLSGEIGDTLLLLEHPPTLTLGRKAHPEHLLATPERLEREGIEVIEVDRGGDISYHWAGQLVGYPILYLRHPPHRADLHLYLRDLEETLIQTLATFGIAAARFPGYTGVWTGMPTEEEPSNSTGLPNTQYLIPTNTQEHPTPNAQQPATSAPVPAKIAAIGIKSSRWITQHGFAINVCPNLAHFDLIVPCGIRDSGVTSLVARCGHPVSVEEVLSPLIEAFQTVFGYQSLDRLA